jgi:hypothetical protein
MSSDGQKAREADNDDHDTKPIERNGCSEKIQVLLGTGSNA